MLSLVPLSPRNDNLGQSCRAEQEHIDDAPRQCSIHRITGPSLDSRVGNATQCAADLAPFEQES